MFRSTPDPIQASIARENAETYERMLAKPDVSAEDRARLTQRVALWRAREAYNTGTGPLAPAVAF